MNTLQTDLLAFKQEFQAKLSKEKAAIMERADSELAAKNILKTAKRTGDKAPDFTLPDATGRQVSLKETLASGPAIVLFYRGGWCPYCNLELRAYQRVLPTIREAGAQILAISPQNPDESLTTQEKNALAFPVLSDTGNKTAEAFGILFDLPEFMISLFKELGHDLPSINQAGTWALPVPAGFVISQEGIIVASHADIDYRTRLDPVDALKAVMDLKKS